MKMSVYNRNFSLYLNNNDKQHSIDYRNNNVKNSNKSFENAIESTKVQTNNDQIDMPLSSENGNDAQLKCKNGIDSCKMQNDIRSNQSHSNESIETTKPSATINFSVDSILNSGTSNAISKPTINDDFSRIHRPMPMRYMPNSNIFQGNQHQSRSFY